MEKVNPSLPRTTSITSVTPLSKHSFASFAFIGLEALVISGKLVPKPPQNNFIPPPVPVGSIVAPLYPSSLNLSAPIVAYGNTVEDPTILIVSLA